jgi:hypothetical protein
MIPSFREQLIKLINEHNEEQVSNTPDFILAEYMEKCLLAFEFATIRRDGWYGVQLIPGNKKFLRD